MTTPPDTHRFNRDRLLACLGALGARQQPLRLFDDLAAAYAESGRHYHTAAHIDDCLGHLDRLWQMADHPEEVEAAIWFHDAIYDTRRGDNEARSADWAREALSACDAPAEAISRIGAMTRATRDHDAQTGDTALLMDIDLAILGAPWPAFQAYDRAIRREYAWVPEETYRTGRSQVLRGFLEKDALYAIPAFRQGREDQARANLARRLQEMERR